MSQCDGGSGPPGSWQLSEEGYNVVLIAYPAPAEALQASFADARNRLEGGTEWALLTYGLESADLGFAAQLLGAGTLKACAHYCPQAEFGEKLVHERADGSAVP